MVSIEKIVIYMKLRAKFYFLAFICFLGTYSLKVVQNWFVWHEIWHTTLFGIYYCIEMVIIENNSHMFEITCEVPF